MKQVELGPRFSRLRATVTDFFPLGQEIVYEIRCRMFSHGFEFIDQTFCCILKFIALSLLVCHQTLFLDKLVNSLNFLHII